MNMIIPFVYLMNDEETKGIISEENWIQGLRHMLGVYNQSKPEDPSIQNRDLNLSIRRRHPLGLFRS